MVLAPLWHLSTMQTQAGQAHGSVLLNLESKAADGSHQILMLSIYEALRAGLWSAEGEADALLFQNCADG